MGQHVQDRNLARDVVLVVTLARIDDLERILYVTPHVCALVQMLVPKGAILICNIGVIFSGSVLARRLQISLEDLGEGARAEQLLLVIFIVSCGHLSRGEHFAVT